MSNRELKFKFLDVKNNKFWINGKGWDLYSLFVSYREQIADKENYQLIEFTGLADKNGKEIYEGDILKDSNGTLTEIKFGEFNCGCCDYIYGFTFGRYQNKDQEVVGNIFENPELLKNNS
jgi:uncharacterized phage protein (TIGR01671 family)